MKKNKISIIQISRLIIQIAFFIFLPALYINTFAGIKQIYTAIINQNFDFTQLIPEMVEVAITVPFTIIMGRFFCGWMCAFGAFGDFIYKISSKVFKIKYKVNEDVDSVLKYLKYVLLAFLIFFVCTFDITTFSTFSPWDVFGMVATVGNVPDFAYVAANLTAGFILFILITVASMFVERFFCRYLCPLGAVFALTSKFKIAKIRKTRTKCGICKVCTNNCAMGIPLYKTDVVNSVECINCMKCVNSCPRKNATMTISGDDVRPLIAGAAAVTVMTGFYYAGNIGVKAAGLENIQIETGSSLGISNDIYKDGTYTGSGIGYRNRTTTVSVVVKNGKISDITTVSTGDDGKFYNRAFSTVSGEIIDSQSTDVDTVSGATFSSNGIMQAVANALSNAKISTGIYDSASTDNKQQDTSSQAQTEASKSSNTADSSSSAASNTQQNSSSQTQTSSNAASTSAQYKDGTYEGSGTGFRGGTTTVSVTVKSGKVTDITSVSTRDDRKFYVRAFSTVMQEILSSQTSNVDTVSGATFSSKGIMEAVQNALSKAK